MFRMLQQIGETEERRSNPPTPPVPQELLDRVKAASEEVAALEPVEMPVTPVEAEAETGARPGSTTTMIGWTADGVRQIYLLESQRKAVLALLGVEYMDDTVMLFFNSGRGAGKSTALKTAYMYHMLLTDYMYQDFDWEILVREYGWERSDMLALKYDRAR